MTTIKLFIVLFLSALLLTTTAFAEDKKCVLPAPDYRPPDMSDPSAKGSITKIKSGALEIEALINEKNHKKPIRLKIRINKETSVFTSFGGYVAKKDLIVGTRVNVWYVGCSTEKAGSPPLAAVIEVVVR